MSFVITITKLATNSVSAFHRNRNKTAAAASVKMSDSFKEPFLHSNLAGFQVCRCKVSNEIFTLSLMNEIKLKDVECVYSAAGTS